MTKQKGIISKLKKHLTKIRSTPKKFFAFAILLTLVVYILSLSNSETVLIGGLFKSNETVSDNSAVPTENLIIPSPDPSPTLIPAPKKVQSVYIDPDPITNCNNPNCGSIQIPKSQCSDTGGYVCCQIKNKWIWYSSRDQCKKDQNSIVQATNSKTPVMNTPSYPTYNSKLLVNCVVNYPCTGESYTYQLYQESCTSAQQAALAVRCASQSNNSNSYTVPQFNLKTEPLPTLKEIPQAPYWGVKCSDIRGEVYITELHCDPD